MGVEPRPLKSATEPWQKQPNLGVVFRPFLYTSCQGCLRGKESLGGHADITQAWGHQRHAHAGHLRLHKRVRKGVQVIRPHTCSLYPFPPSPSGHPGCRWFLKVRSHELMMMMMSWISSAFHKCHSVMCWKKPECWRNTEKTLVSSSTGGGTRCSH